MTPADFTGRKEVVPLRHARLEDGRMELSFEFRKQRFLLNRATACFEKLAYYDQARGLTAHTPAVS